MEGGERCAFCSWKYSHYFEFWARLRAHNTAGGDENMHCRRDRRMQAGEGEVRLGPTDQRQRISLQISRLYLVTGGITIGGKVDTDPNPWFLTRPLNPEHRNHETQFVSLAPKLNSKWLNGFLRDLSKYVYDLFNVFIRKWLNLLYMDFNDSGFVNTINREIDSFWNINQNTANPNILRDAM